MPPVLLGKPNVIPRTPIKLLVADGESIPTAKLRHPPKRNVVVVVVVVVLILILALVLVLVVLVVASWYKCPPEPPKNVSNS